MLGLAEEIGLIGADDIQQMDDLVLLSVRAKQILTVLGKGVELQAAQPPLDAKLEHGLFVRIQIDARLLVDQAAQPPKVRVGDTVFASTHVGTSGLDIMPRRSCVAVTRCSPVSLFMIRSAWFVVRGSSAWFDVRVMKFRARAGRSLAPLPALKRLLAQAFCWFQAWRRFQAGPHRCYVRPPDPRPKRRGRCPES